VTNQTALKFSVLIPCRNAGDWIENTLASVVSQSLQPAEIIVIDDGSTDDSIEKIRSFDSAIRILHSEHRNGAGTRNIGIAAATGDWIAFLDADDVWYPNHLERAANLLSESNDVGFLNWFDHFSNEDPNARVSRPNRLDIPEPASGLTDLQFFRNYARTHWFNMHGCVVRRDRLLEVGMLDTTQIRRHDIEMWLRVVHQHTWSYDPTPSSAYRIDTPGSISRSVADASYYWYVAMKKNFHCFPKKIGEQLLQHSSRASVVNALMHGSVEEVRRAFKEPIKQLNFPMRFGLRTAQLAPPLFRYLLRIKQAVKS